MLADGDAIDYGNAQNGFSFATYQSLTDPDQKFARFFIDDCPFVTFHKPLNSEAVIVEIEKFIPVEKLDVKAINQHETVFRQNLTDLIDQAGEKLGFDTDCALNIEMPAKHEDDIRLTLARQIWETWGDMRERIDPIRADIAHMFGDNEAVQEEFYPDRDGFTVTYTTPEI